MNIDRKPHLHVIWTQGGKEQKILNILYREIIEKPEALAGDLEKNTGRIVAPSEEYAFIPRIIMRKKFKGGWKDCPRYFISGYMFLNTNAPVDFFRRIRDSHLLFKYGLYVGILKNEIDINSWEAEWPESMSLTEYREMLEKKFGFGMAPLTENEEKQILSLCGMERSVDGSLFRYRENDIQNVDPEIIKECGLAQIASIYSSTKIKSDGSVEIGMSHGVKLVEGSNSGGKTKNGGKTKTKIIVLGGPLKNFQGEIVHVNAHKREATVRLRMMNNMIDVKLPLEIVKVIEVPAA